MKTRCGLRHLFSGPKWEVDLLFPKASKFADGFLCSNIQLKGVVPLCCTMRGTAEQTLDLQCHDSHAKEVYPTVICKSIFILLITANQGLGMWLSNTVLAEMHEYLASILIIIASI